MLWEPSYTVSDGLSTLQCASLRGSGSFSFQLVQIRGFCRRWRPDTSNGDGNYDEVMQTEKCLDLGIINNLTLKSVAWQMPKPSPETMILRPRSSQLTVSGKAVSNACSTVGNVLLLTWSNWFLLDGTLYVLWSGLLLAMKQTIIFQSSWQRARAHLYVVTNNE